MKRAVVVASSALAISGCASLIGASFDDAGLTEYDASSDVHEASLKFDVADSKPFDPTAIPNLAFWLDAHAQVDIADASSQVTTWHDLSGHLGRDATYVSGYGIPTLASSGINGQPSVHFDSKSWQLLGSSWVGPGSTEFTLFIVVQGYPNSAVRFENGPSTFPLIVFPLDFAGNEQAPNLGFEIANSNTDYATARSNIGPGPTIAVASFRSNGIITTYTNGSLVEQRLSSTLSTSGTKLFIGGIPYPSSIAYTDGDIGEVIVYDSALSDIDRGKVEGYLSVKWSIAL